jgi:hypothetical protein
LDGAKRGKGKGRWEKRKKEKERQEGEKGRGGEVRKGRRGGEVRKGRRGIGDKKRERECVVCGPIIKQQPPASNQESVSLHNACAMAG